MGNSLFGWQNNIVASVIQTATPGPLALNAGNLRNDQGSPSMGWQTDGLTGSVDFDMQTIPSTWRAFVLARTNLSATATVRWRIDTTYDSGVIPANVAAGYQQSVLILPSPVAGRKLTLDVADPDNPDGFINIPLLYAGPCWQPIISPTYETTKGLDDTTDEVVTQGGQEFPIFRFARRRWSVALDGVRTSETYTQLSPLDATSRRNGNVLFVPYIQSADLNKMAVYGRCKPTADVGYSYAGADARSWKANITERL